jgi:hypothetical protein
LQLEEAEGEVCKCKWRFTARLVLALYPGGRVLGVRTARRIVKPSFGFGARVGVDAELAFSEFVSSRFKTVSGAYFSACLIKNPFRTIRMSPVAEDAAI